MIDKLLLHNSIIKPTWTYGLELWGSTKPSNFRRPLQSKILLKILHTPFYVSNLTLHNDLKVPLVSLGSSLYKKFHCTLHLHPNPLVQALSSLTLPLNPPSCIWRHWSRDLLKLSESDRSTIDGK